MEKGLILVVEDEKPIAELVRMYLQRDGYGVELQSDGVAGLNAARRLRPAACILDIALPSMEGTEICRRLRADEVWVPIIFLTARDDEVDRIVGLELGADDYLTKPFSPRELVARLKAVLRRSAGTLEPDRTRKVGAVRIDPASRSVNVGDAPVQLTSTEFDLLMHLMSRPGRVYTRDELLSAVWGYAAHGGTRTVDVHVAQVRAKLGEAAPIIRTVRGVGYTADA